MYFDFNELKINDKYIQLIGDFIIREDVCNLSCDYCLCEGAELKDKHHFERIDGKLNYNINDLADMCYTDGYELKENIDRGMETYYKYFDTPIMKYSGGEVFLIKNFIDMLSKYSENHEVVQILTNGTLLSDEIVEQLSEIKNLNIQFSIDGHTLDMNYNRTKSIQMNKLLLNNFDKIVRNGIDIEAYSVISITNVNKLTDFAKYLYDLYGNKVHFTFFPVRQGAAKKYFPKDDSSGIDQLIENYDKFESILPPKEYIYELRDYMNTGERKSRCYVPLIMFQNFDDGIITPCPNCWTVNLGNIINESDNVISKLGQDRVYNLMTNLPPITPFCKKCFADYHLFNLYFNDTITLQDMNRPLLKGKKTQERLIQIKDILKQNFSKAKDINGYVK